MKRLRLSFMGGALAGGALIGIVGAAGLIAAYVVPLPERIAFEDAVVVDATDLSIEQVVVRCMELVENAGAAL